jgi:hypothetical protein
MEEIGGSSGVEEKEGKKPTPALELEEGREVFMEATGELGWVDDERDRVRMEGRVGRSAP